MGLESSWSRDPTVLALLDAASFKSLDTGLLAPLVREFVATESYARSPWNPTRDTRPRFSQPFLQGSFPCRLLEKMGSEDPLSKWFTHCTRDSDQR